MLGAIFCSPDRVGSARDGRGLVNGARAARSCDDACAFAADANCLPQAVQVLLFLPVYYTHSEVIDRALVLRDCRTSGLTEVECASFNSECTGNPLHAPAGEPQLM